MACSPAAIDRFFDALVKMDHATARACFTPDAIVWHSYDRIPMGFPEYEKVWSFTERFSKLAFVDVRRQPIAGGFLQQHLIAGTLLDGTHMRWACCLVIEMKDDLIHRIDEYNDRAGFVSETDSMTTPGLLPAREKE